MIKHSLRPDQLAGILMGQTDPQLTDDLVYELVYTIRNQILNDLEGYLCEQLEDGNYD